MTLIKQIVKDVMPAPLWNTLHRWKHNERCYRTWEEAERACPGYDNDLVTRFRLARDVGKPVVPLDDTHPLTHTIANLGGVVRITDLGGGTGALAKRILARFPNASVTVVEHPGMVAAAHPTQGITWATTIPEECDIFNSGGTLQYLATPYEMLDRGLRSAKFAATITRNSFSKEETIRVQRCRLYDNGSGPIPAGFRDQLVAYPHRTIREDRVMEIAAVRGFTLVGSTLENSGALSFHGMVYGKDLFFQRHNL